MWVPDSAGNGGARWFLLRMPRKEGFLKNTMSHQPAIKTPMQADASLLLACLLRLVAGHRVWRRTMSSARAISRFARHRPSRLMACTRWTRDCSWFCQQRSACSAGERRHANHRTADAGDPRAPLGSRTMSRRSSPCDTSSSTRPLSQRYIVRNLNSGDQDSFATLYSALNSLGRVQGLPVIDDALLHTGSGLPRAVARNAQHATIPGATAAAVFLAR